jgi:hypothetical protein
MSICLLSTYLRGRLTAYKDLAFNHGGVGETLLADIGKNAGQAESAQFSLLNGFGHEAPHQVRVVATPRRGLRVGGAEIIIDVETEGNGGWVESKTKPIS